MMNNIFNQFDPNSMMMNPFMLLMILLMLTKSSNNKPSTNETTMKSWTQKMMQENSNNMNPNNKKSSNLMITNILLSISIINILSLIPYSWSSTSHTSFNIPLIMVMWSPILLFILKNKKKNFFIHLIPQSTPNFILPFIFMIEMISFFIRPITLMMRLTANMIAGHTLMLLNSNMIMNTKNPSSLIFNITLTILTLMESIIAILQAYIIMILISMFMSEI